MRTWTIARVTFTNGQVSTIESPGSRADFAEFYSPGCIEISTDASGVDYARIVATVAFQPN